MSKFVENAKTALTWLGGFVMGTLLVIAFTIILAAMGEPQSWSFWHIFGVV